jgi:hypothetical protein
MTFSATHMYFYKAYGLNIRSEILLPELSEGNPDAEYHLEILSGTVNLPELKKTQIYRRGIRAYFGQDPENNLFLQWDEIGSFQAIEGRQLIVSPLTNDANLISLFTVSEALGLILFQRGYFLLHASSVQVGNEAWCFMGLPGAGKSTTAAAFLKAGCKLLSDDLTAIIFTDGIAFVVPAYPQLKIWDKTVEGLEYDQSKLQPVSEGVNKFSYSPKSDFLHNPVKLGEVFFLHKARNRKNLGSLSASEIPTETLRNFPLPIKLLKNDALKNHFFQSFQCAGTANMWRKKRPDGFENLQKWVEESIPKTSIVG